MEHFYYYTLDELDIDTVQVILFQESRRNRGQNDMVQESRAIAVATKQFPVDGLTIEQIDSWAEQQMQTTGATAMDFIMEHGEKRPVTRKPGPPEQIRNK